MNTTDVTISLVRLTIRTRQVLVDRLRDKGGGAFRDIADAFEEDVGVLERARDALVCLRDRVAELEADR
jgi:hypothetical protein